MRNQLHGCVRKPTPRMTDAEFAERQNAAREIAEVRFQQETERKAASTRDLKTKVADLEERVKALESIRNERDVPGQDLPAGDRT